ncbi:beta-phosphoglucomutase family hydrolase [Desulfobacula sp.]|uniref:beta-phosphoglucomutase family hydrolase n=1 Tax=Desulfobacula sp. TaxID=2593537 RepID=UPI0025C708BE|nr:beta-phosphoglucomutase family hydrolase [Desulfobacula sp.]MBC2703235.1 beta-phosphoglucomutase family hydrolase [Desulfobacula sp.]
MATRKQILNPELYDAVLFDLDGVVTRTADTHATAWKKLFDEYLKKKSGTDNYIPFNLKEDYIRYVDGKPRNKGIKSFIASRSIDIPYGSVHDAPDKETVCGLGNRKNQLFSDLLKKEGVKVYKSTIDLIRQLRKNRFKTAIVSSSKNCRQILKIANVEALFDVRVDGVVSESLGLTGKPEPDTFLEAARRLDTDVNRCVVVEDALSGVEAGAKGGFGMVIGINRGNQAKKLKQKGAHLVVNDLSEIEAGMEKETGWDLIYLGFDPEDEGRREAMCALGNGYFVTRGAAPEAKADDVHYPGTYLAGGYNRLKTEIAGRIVENEDLVNIPNWLCLNFRIPGEEWFQLKDVKILFYKQSLIIKKGILNRTICFRDKKNRETHICQHAFVHGDQMHRAALKTIITPLNWEGKIEICSALDGRVTNQGVKRYRDLSKQHFDRVDSRHIDEKSMVLKMRTNQSCIDIAMGARTNIFLQKNLAAIKSVPADKPGGYVAKNFIVDVSKRDDLTVEKLVCIYTSRDKGISECLLEVENTIANDVESFDSLLKSHVTAWELLWRKFDVTLELDNSGIEQYTQKIIRLYIFHLLQSSSVHSLDIDVGMPARGWHGEGYRGHIFWDEMIIFPFLNYRAPQITKTLLMYRYRRLEEARRAARKAGCKGAMYPWQSGSSGREETQQMHLNPESGNWLFDYTYLQRHVNNAIVYNIWQYFQATYDTAFLSFYGGEIIIEIARFWASIATYDPEFDRYEIMGVMGPDEYHDAYPGADKPGLNNNAYTNLMVMFVMDQALNLRHVISEQDWEYLKKKLEVEDKELEQWKKISRRIKLVFHGGGILSQFEGYENLKEFDWDGYKKKYGNIRRLDRILEKEGDSTNNYKLCKQADVLMLLYLFSAETLRKMFKRLNYTFDKELIPKNINYYLNRTTNGSSLALVIHAWIEARQARERSWDFFSRALETDMVDDRTGSTREGIHLAAMSGCIDILQRGYAGLEIRSDILILNPLLPKPVNRICFHVRYRNHWLDLEITQTDVKVKSLTSRARPVMIMIKDEIIRLYPGKIAYVDI